MQRLVKSSRRRTGCRQWISNGSERGVPDRTVARQTQPRTLAGGTWIAGLEAGAVAPAAKSAQRTERWAGRAADQCGAVHLPSRAAMIFTPPEARTEPLCGGTRAHLRLPPGSGPPQTAAGHLRWPASLAGRAHPRPGLPAVSVPLIHAAWARNSQIGGCRSDQLGPAVDVCSCTRQAAACRVPLGDVVRFIVGSQPA